MLVPPNLDIYGLTKHRDIQTINRFLDKYVDRTANEDRGDGELMMRPLDMSNFTDTTESYDWEPALTLTNSIQRGLDYPCRSFSIYLTMPHDTEMGALLHFTEDDQLVLGLSIDDGDALPENEELAKSLLMDLRGEFGCHMGLITVSDPPPSSESEFKDAIQKPLTVFLWQQYL